MGIQVDVEKLIDEVLSYRDREVPEERRQMVRRTARKALEETVRLNPVDTGRSRSAWVESLKRLDGVPPAGWQGAKAELGAIEEGRQKSLFQEEGSQQTNEVIAGNRVDYINFLEFGTSRFSPFAMVRRAMQIVRQYVKR